MREIKFRAFLKKNKIVEKKYVKKDVLTLIEIEKGLYDVVALDFQDKEAKLYDWDKQVEFKVSFSVIELLQYTGEKDKNGKEIYDGYVLKLDRDKLLKNLEPEDIPDDTLIQVVAFEDGAFTARSRSGRKWGSVGGMFEYGEIIGNIYENPKLLQ